MRKSDDLHGYFSVEELVDIFKKLSTRPEIYHLLVRLVFFIERIISIKWTSFLDILKVKIFCLPTILSYFLKLNKAYVFFYFYEKKIEFVFI